MAEFEVRVFTGVPPPTCRDAIPNSCHMLAAGRAQPGDDHLGQEVVLARVVAMDAGRIGFTRLYRDGVSVADYLATASAQHEVVVGVEMAINLSWPAEVEVPVTESAFDHERAVTAIAAADAEFA